MDNENKAKMEELKDEELEEVAGGVGTASVTSHRITSDKVATKMPSTDLAHTPVVTPSKMPKALKK